MHRTCCVRDRVSLCICPGFPDAQQPRLADIQISTSSSPAPLSSWQVRTLPQHPPRIHLLLFLGLVASRVNLGQRLSIGFLFPSCCGWQKGMCQDSTEGPLIDEEGQAANEGFWFNYVEAVHECTDTQMGITSKCQ